MTVWVSIAFLASSVLFGQLRESAFCVADAVEKIQDVETPVESAVYTPQPSVTDSETEKNFAASDEVSSSKEDDSVSMTTRPPEPPKLNTEDTTVFSGFCSGVFTSFSLTTITEFGDRTFFIAALMALKYGSAAVMLGASSALCLQTVFSVGFGRFLHRIPSSATKTIRSIPLDDYAAATMLFLFGFIHLREALAEAPDTAECPSEIAEARDSVEQVQYMKLTSRPTFLEILRETFWAVFIAELGDKSMISTIALATAQNPYGVYIGSCMAHILLTAVAIIAGSLTQDYISHRLANGVGACLFLSYALLTTIEGLTRQGITMWGLSSQKAAIGSIVAFVAGFRKYGPGVRNVFSFLPKVS